MKNNLLAVTGKLIERYTSLRLRASNYESIIHRVEEDGKGRTGLIMGNVKRIRIYRRHHDKKEWISNCLVSIDDHPEIKDCVPDLLADVKGIIEENLMSVKGQIWLAGEISVSEVTYGWVSEDAAELLKEEI